MNNFYHEIITEHNLHPTHKIVHSGVLPSAPGSTHDQTKNQSKIVTIHAHNPYCGDEYDYFLQTDGQIITDINFAGQGCAISQASNDIMADLLIGHQITDAQNIITQFFQLIHARAPADEKILGEAVVLRSVQNLPARAKCATLGWRSLEQLLRDMI